MFIFMDLIQNTIKEGHLRFDKNNKNQMKVDVEPLPIVDTNYVEPANINMVEVIDANEATEGLINKDNNVETTDDYVAGIEMRKATEGLQFKFQEVKINDGPNLEVNMMDMN